jgi:glycerol-3-phosphate O-acyltransferase
LTRVCSKETKTAKLHFAEITRDIEDINEQIESATEAHTKLAVISDDLLITEKKLSIDKDQLTDNLDSLQKKFDRRTVSITEKFENKVATCTML